jgi:predicted XRE-type DNA-binding protein
LSAGGDNIITIDRLIEMLSRVGKPVRLAVD